jgi:dinuclear metal center YbgI/SA1388 family protein
MTETGGSTQREEGKGASAGGGPTVGRTEIAAWLDTFLESPRFADYCPNGLQVEGAPRVARVVCGVTASLALVRAAARAGAQALLVHHGWFWRGEDPRVLGPRRERLATLLAHDISLFAYHLPLDVHPDVGNNVQLARRLGWPDGEPTGRDGLLRVADLPSPLDAPALSAGLARALDREPLLVGDLARPLRRIAWCTGAAQDMLQQAIDAGADAFVSGEISERTTHLAREAGVVYAAAGHHATERGGVQALGEALARRFGIEVVFVDDPNPV